MPPRSILVTGNLREVYRRLNMILEVVRNRVAEGWRPLQSDEIWVYSTAPGGRTCLECLAFEGSTLQGDEISLRFPFFEFVSQNIIHPQIHPGCRCNLSWINAGEVLVDRLHSEMEAV